MENNQYYISENKKVYLVLFTEGFTISYKDIEWRDVKPIKSILIENLLREMDIYSSYTKEIVRNINFESDSVYLTVRVNKNRITIGSNQRFNLEDAKLNLLKRLYE